MIECGLNSNSNLNSNSVSLVSNRKKNRGKEIEMRKKPKPKTQSHQPKLAQLLPLTPSRTRPTPTPRPSSAVFPGLPRTPLAPQCALTSDPGPACQRPSPAPRPTRQRLSSLAPARSFAAALPSTDPPGPPVSFFPPPATRLRNDKAATSAVIPAAFLSEPGPRDLRPASFKPPAIPCAPYQPPTRTQTLAAIPA